MDVDVIFQQGYVYTLATLCVLGVFYALFFCARHRSEDLSPIGNHRSDLRRDVSSSSPSATGFRSGSTGIFYHDRYDYRRTLVEFARELSSETDLDTMLESVADRLLQTLSIRHVLSSCAAEDEDRVRPSPCDGHGEDRAASRAADNLDLSFLHRDLRSRTCSSNAPAMRSTSSRASGRHLSGTHRRSRSHLLPALHRRGRTIAYLGVSRTDKGDFLSSDDLELLVTLSGYVGIAIENAAALPLAAAKVAEYERLKEFSENIVESINVGILAADLEDRVESWNTQIERLTGIPREHARRPHALRTVSRRPVRAVRRGPRARPASTTSISSS